MEQLGIEKLQLRVQRLERMLAFSLAGLAAAVSLVFWGGWVFQQQSKTEDMLRVRQIVIVDEKGVDRMYIGSPVPDPMIDGKRYPRRLKSSGVIMNDAKGNEVGGWGVLEDGTQQLIFDDGNGVERIALFQPASGKRGGIVMKDERGSFRVFIGAVNSDDQRFVLRDPAGRMRYEACVRFDRQDGVVLL